MWDGAQIDFGNEFSLVSHNVKTQKIFLFPLQEQGESKLALNEVKKKDWS